VAPFLAHPVDVGVHIIIIIIIIIIITMTIIHMTMSIVLSSWLRAIARVHPVHLTYADSAPDGCQPSEQAKQLGL